MDAAVSKYLEEYKDQGLTVTGLALYLGFHDLQSLYEKQKDERFHDIIKRARLFVANDYENSLRSNACVGAIFALKNMGWSDRQEISLGMDDKMQAVFASLPEQYVVQIQAALKSIPPAPEVKKLPGAS